MSEIVRNYTTLETEKAVLTGFSKIVNQDTFGGQPSGYKLDLLLEANDPLVLAIKAAHEDNLQFESMKGKGTEAKLGAPIKVPASTYPNVADLKDPVVVTMKTQVKPAVFNRAGDSQELTQEINLGSKVNVRLMAASYNFGGRIGTSLYLNELQVVAQSAETASAAKGFKPVDGVEKASIDQIFEEAQADENIRF